MSEVKVMPPDPTEEMISAYLQGQAESCFRSDHELRRIDPRRHFADGYKAMHAVAPASRLTDGRVREIAVAFEDQWRQSSMPISELIADAIRVALAQI